jgi:hypothetical protein
MNAVVRLFLTLRRRPPVPAGELHSVHINMAHEAPPEIGSQANIVISAPTLMKFPTPNFEYPSVIILRYF